MSRVNLGAAGFNRPAKKKAKDMTIELPSQMLLSGIGAGIGAMGRAKKKAKGMAMGGAMKKAKGMAKGGAMKKAKGMAKGGAMKKAKGGAIRRGDDKMVAKMKGGGAAMPMKMVGGKKVPAFAADGKGANDLMKKAKGGKVMKKAKGGTVRKMMGGGMAMKKAKGMKRGGKVR
jgi:hypothetical protein